jgi:flagellum-specific ATP synthase
MVNESPDKTAKGPYHFPRFGEADASSHDGSSEKDTAVNAILKALEQEAYERGMREGEEQTYNTEASKYEPLKNLLSRSKIILAEHQSALQRRFIRDVTSMSVQLAKHILKSEIAKRPEVTRQIAGAALQLVRGQESIRIKVHPDDTDVIENLHKEMLPDAGDHIQVVPDHHMERGGCLIETDFGMIDARIDQQLTAIANHLQGMMNRQGSVETGGGEGISDFNLFHRRIESTATIKASGFVSKVVGLVVEANGPAVQLGSMCDIFSSGQSRPIPAEVLGFRDRTVLMMPLEEIRNIGPGSRVVAREDKAAVDVGRGLLGRVIDGLGHPIDGKGPLSTENSYPIYAKPVNPLLRQRIRKPLDLGIRCINGLLTVGCGQRMGIFAGSGVGKSVTMGMIARNSQADVNVIALIGERGRELNDFIEKDLGPEGLEKSIVVVATSDHLPLVRVRGAFVATAIAEFFRDQGLHVNLMMDSVTRFAMAQREIGLALGEPPTTKGYTPSVFTLLPKLLERAGTSDHDGTITGLYTVLVEGDDMNEPIADAARSILDGHIVLSRDLAAQNHYPAIDVLRSISRVMEDITALQHKHNAGRLKELLATYRKAEDLINIGAYNKGSNTGIDRAIEKIDAINGFLRQGIRESVNFEDSLVQLDHIMNTP